MIKRKDRSVYSIAKQVPGEGEDVGVNSLKNENGDVLIEASMVKNRVERIHGEIAECRL